MALTATVHIVDLDLTDHDRGVYETLSMRVARHPSESDEYLATRLLAYALEYADGLTFSAAGLSTPDEPAMALRDLTGGLQAWIEIGWPDAARLHRAAKAAPRVAIYPHKDATQWLRRLAGERIHRASEIVIRAIDPALIDGLAGRIDRRMAFGVAVSGDELFVSIGEDTLTGRVQAHRLA